MICCWACIEVVFTDHSTELLCFVPYITGKPMTDQHDFSFLFYVGSLARLTRPLSPPSV